MNITALMVAFLLHLSTEEQIDLCKAKKIQNDPNFKHFLVWKWMYIRQWDLYVYMQEAIDQFIKIEEHRKDSIRINKTTKQLDYHE